MPTARELPASPRPAGGSPGVVTPSDLYRVDELRARLGWSESAYQSARKQGLKIFRAGKRSYVRGSDAIAYVTKEATS